ncbi:hypothetical protein [Mesorhizobium sp. M0058]|uniref:hypothetical protein n=1 Tax=Mesorhizobium sp. M0058 TaxID=2956865 RepID=UPI003335F693
MNSSKPFYLGAILVAGAWGSMAQPAFAQEVCIYASKAYAKGFTGCFRHVALECNDFNDWREVGSCADEGVPGGNDAPGLPDSLAGVLCNAGGHYSPDSEGCIAGFYQRCEADGNWTKNITAIDGAACPE